MTGPQLYLKCESCSKVFAYHGGKRRRFCSNACKMAAWRRQTAPQKIDGVINQKQNERPQASNDGKSK